MHGRMFKCPRCGRVVIVDDCWINSDAAKISITCPVCKAKTLQGRPVNYDIDAGSEDNQGGKAEPGMCLEDILAPLVDGTLSVDGYLHMRKGDVLVLWTEKMLLPSHVEEFEKTMSEKTGIKVVLIDRVSKVVGVVEHGEELQ